MVTDKMLCGQNGIEQNSSGQNGTDKMARTKCYADKILSDKKGIDKMVDKLAKCYATNI